MFNRIVLVAALLPAGALVAAPQAIRHMAVMQTHYEARVGEPIEVPVAADTRDFIAHAKTRRVTIDGKDVPGLVIAPNDSQDKILLAPNSKAAPGTYAVTLSATSAGGDEMNTEVDVVVKPRATVPKGNTRAPVVLLNGWISGYNGGTCTIATSSSTTFGNLAQYLVQDGVPVVFLFDNCLEDANAPIETLGQDLADFLASIKYDDGSQVTQIDLVAHSIGGLIARAYLEGLQTNQTYLPPYAPLVHNLVLIATPNFGSFVVGNNSVAIQNGTQASQLIPGSATLWNLATWNQRGDDLAGVNAMAIVGNAGSYSIPTSSTVLLNASDGLISTTSASLGFIIPTPKTNPTRVVNYCHVDPSVFTTTLLGTFNCTQPGIANVTSTSHPTGQIVRSFLAGTADWKSIGTSPTADTYLKNNGGAFFALQNITAGYANDITSVTWGGNVAFTNGGNYQTIYYADFVAGTGNFTAVSSSLGTVNCGSLALPVGSFSAFRCKLNLAIACAPKSTTCQGAVTPLAGVPGVAVASGSTLTIAGQAFGTQCSNCKVYATPAGSTTPTTLTVSSWTNTAISVQMPDTLTGYQTLQVNAVGGIDAIGVRALAAAASPALTLDTTSLNFSYTTSGSIPAAQPFNITNSGGGTLAWTAAVDSKSTWLSLDSLSGTAPSAVNVSVNPVLLSAGTYTGTITIKASGASNSPATVSVTLVVSGSTTAALTANPTSLSFAYTSGSAPPAAQPLTISSSGGSFTWTATSNNDWVTVSPASGALGSTATVTVTPQNLAGANNATITIAASDNSVSPITIPVTVTVTGTPPAPTISAVGNGASYATNIASATWVTIFGSNLSQLTYLWQGVDIVNGALPTSVQGVSVTINGIPAYIDYLSASQINVLAPDDATTGPVQVVVTVAGQASNSFAVQKNAVSPAFLTFDGQHAAAEHLDYTLLGPPGVLPIGTFTPAVAGETVILYGVGFGPTTPAVPTGQSVLTAEPLATTPTMTIGGVSVTPMFAGLSASGLYQFNVQLPASLPSGNAAVSATVNGVTTQTGVVLIVQ